ncbi:MAG: GNAT family N-acetyltransferase [Chloroflexota bacterium]
MTQINYQIGFPDEERQRAASLYDAAFGEKFGIGIPNKTQRLAVLADGFEPSRSITAVHEGHVVGMAGFHDQESSLTGGITAEILRRHTGWLGMLRAVVVFAFFERKPKPDELLMDGITVDPAMRGQGVGTGLLRELFVYAKEQGYQTIRLDVINTNPRARSLYEREGFVATETASFAFLEGILGFSASTTMQKEV